MKPIIKWTGGKSREIKEIEKFIPKNFSRYIEPFLGGGAMFFHLQPEQAAINDISKNLMDFYRLIQNQDDTLRQLLVCYNDSFTSLIKHLRVNSDVLLSSYREYVVTHSENGISQGLKPVFDSMPDSINTDFYEQLLIDKIQFDKMLELSVIDKYKRTDNNEKKKLFFQNSSVIDNLITGFTSGYYLYFRKVFNDINLGKIKIPEKMHPLQYRIANFYFIREYCYGSMFRYNKEGEFNIPYGGISYNKKNLQAKIDNMFNQNISVLFENAQIVNEDFEKFINELSLTEEDFMFLDPPYDTVFSDYEGNAFTKEDQIRLANVLLNTKAQFILVIKNTDFIYNLYSECDRLKIYDFDKTYTYNVKGRNNRDVKHLIITNLKVI